MSERELLDFALELATAAEGAILTRYGRVTASIKADGSEVTEADREAERVMRAMIAARYPDHSILGEELGGNERPVAGLQWLLDPLDGTASFTLGLPLFGTLVGLLQDGEPVIGVMHFPVLHETVYAARGAGCWFRWGAEAPCRVRVGSARHLPEAVVLGPSGLASVPAEMRVWHFQCLLRPLRDARKFRFGGDCMQHALVCRGRAHAAIDPVMHPWDIAAIIPCVREAGGVATTLDGEAANVVFGGSLVTACDERLHQEVLASLRAPVVG